MVKNPLANAGNVGLIRWLGKCPGEGNGGPLQYYCLGNPMDREAWPRGHERVGHDLVTKQQRFGKKTATEFCEPLWQNNRNCSGVPSNI